MNPLIQPIYDLIKDPDHWCQGTLGRDKDNQQICIGHACKFCLVGAVYKVYRHDEDTKAEVLSLINKYGVSPSEFNDSHSHAEVLALLESL